VEISSLHLAILRNEEHYKFFLDFSGLVNKYGTATLKIESLFAASQEALSVEGNSLNVIRKSAITDELTNADALRDATFSGLAGTVKSAQNHFRPNIRAAAVRLQYVFDSFGNLSEKPYIQETAAISKLVYELQNSYSADATTVGIVDWVEELARQNADFDQLMNTRFTESAAKPQENLKLARKETDKVYQAIKKRIEAMIEVEGEALYANFVAELNQRIENFNKTLAQRKGRAAKAKNKSTNNTNQ